MQKLICANWKGSLLNSENGDDLHILGVQKMRAVPIIVGPEAQLAIANQTSSSEQYVLHTSPSGKIPPDHYSQ